MKPYAGSKVLLKLQTGHYWREDWVEYIWWVRMNFEILVNLESLGKKIYIFLILGRILLFLQK